jgi:hypothetical protein
MVSHYNYNPSTDDQLPSHPQGLVEWRFRGSSFLMGGENRKFEAIEVVTT